MFKFKHKILEYWCIMTNNVLDKIVYHTTSIDNANKIIKSNHFRASDKSNEWLGTGVYFWEDKSQSEWWRNNIKGISKENTAIIEVNLKCKFSEYRDLNILDNMKEFETICQEVINNDKFILKSKSDSELRNFYCNYYKRKLKLKLISYDFRIRGSVNKFGFSRRAIQYCLGEEFQKDVLEIKGVDRYV